MQVTLRLFLPQRFSLCAAPRSSHFLPQALSEGEEVTLMGWGNAIMRKLHKDASGAVTAIDAGVQRQWMECLDAPCRECFETVRRVGWVRCTRMPPGPVGVQLQQRARFCRN